MRAQTKAVVLYCRFYLVVAAMITSSFGMISPSPALASTPFPASGVNLYWMDDADPLVVGHQAALNINVIDAPNAHGTFFVYEGATVPGSGTPVAELAISGSGDYELFTTNTDVGASSYFSVKFVTANSSFSDTNFENIRLSCTQGTYSVSGFGPCLKAPQGHYVSEPGSTEYLPCAAGTYQPNTGQMICIPAQPGEYVSGTAASSAEPCSPGSYSSDFGSLTCDLTPPGSFTIISGSIRPIGCAPGTYQPSPGQTGCLDTPAGTYTATEGNTDPTNCAPGTYQPSTGQTGCLDAPAGTYVADVGAITTTQCPDGYFYDRTRASSRDACIAAPAGSYVSSSDKTRRQLCLPGSYQSDLAQSSCIKAKLGFFVNVEGATVQIKCRRGTTTDTVGSIICKRKPTLPKIPKKLSRTSTTNVYLKSGKNSDGLRVTMSTRTKTCKIKKDRVGYKLSGLKKGNCKIAITIKGNKSFASLSTVQTVRVS